MPGKTKSARLVLLAWFACGQAASAAPIPQQAGQSPASPGGAPYRETERGPAHSLIEISVAGQGFSGMVVLLKAVYDIAKERGFAYAFATRPAADPAPPPDGAPGVAAIKVFMTKDRETPLRLLLGADYSQQAQEQFDREGWMSVSQLARMFEADNRGGRASDPLADLIGVFSLTAEGDPAFRVSKTGQDYFVESRGAAGWVKPIRLVVMTDSERAKAAKSGIAVSAGLRMTQGSADQGFDILRIEEALPGSGRTVILHVLFSWFGPNLLYKLP
jgi:hypothetical protein